MNHKPDAESWWSDDQLIGAADLPDYDPAHRAELLAATTRIVRRRRTTRVALRAAAVVLAFVSGMVAMDRLNRGAPQVMPRGEISPVAIDAVVPDSPALFTDPEALARAFEAAGPEERLRLLKAAGDFALNEQGNLREALEYYRQWLRLADAPARHQYDQTDTWLLASLKQDQ